MEHLTDMDVVALALIAIGAVLGLFKGGVRILVGIAAFVTGLVLASRHGAEVVRFADLPVLAEIDLLQRLPAADVSLLESIAGRSVVFTGVLLAGMLLARLLRRVMNGTPLNGYDRLVGAAVGGARGGLVAAVLLVVALSIPHESDEGAWHSVRSDLGDSRTRLVTAELVHAGQSLLPDQVGTWLSTVLAQESLPELPDFEHS